MEYAASLLARLAAEREARIAATIIAMAAAREQILSERNR